MAQDDPMAVQRCVWQCLAGAKDANDPAYGACVASRCGDDEAPADSPATPAADAGPGWTYGADEVIGSSAHIATGSGAIGFTCGSQGPEVTLMVDNGLFQDEDLVLLFDNAPSSVALSRGPGAFSATRDAACFLALSEFRTAHTLFIAPGKLTAIRAEGDQSVKTITLNGRDVGIRRGVEAVDALGARVVPLTGSSRAIETMLAGCPDVRADIANDCGL